MYSLKKLEVKPNIGFGLESFSAASVDEMLQTRGGASLKKYDPNEAAQPDKRSRKMGGGLGRGSMGGGGDGGGIPPAIGNIGNGIVNSFNSWLGSSSGFFDSLGRVVGGVVDGVVYVGGALIEYGIGVITRTSLPPFLDPNLTNPPIDNPNAPTITL